MKIVTNDKDGIGKIKGEFVYIPIDEYGYIDGSPHIASIMGGSSIISSELVSIYEGKLEFDFTSRDIIYDKSDDKVLILSKDDVASVIASLKRVYEGME